MATADISSARREDWILANPWLFALIGLASCLLALGTTQLLGSELHFLRGLFFLVGLSASGISVVQRLNSSRSAFLDQLGQETRVIVLRILGVLFGSAALGLTGALVLSIFGHPEIPWRWGSLFVAWMIVAPMCTYASLACWRGRESAQPIPWGHEAALLLLFAGLSCVLACWSLYFGPEARLEWMTMRLFLSVAAFTAFVSAPFFLVGPGPRRLGVSALLLLHFGGICTAALGQSPSPWLVAQLWGRIYRPYLEFMYLTNAYHFYAPAPDVASHLWFRSIYEDEKGNEHGVWHKIPALDEKGWHGHTTALEYQRHISLTENVAQGSPINANLFDWTVHPLTPNTDEDWIQTYYMVPAMKARWRKTDTAVTFKLLKKKRDVEAKKDVIVGVINPAQLPPPKDDLPFLNPVDHPNVYPFDPRVIATLQYALPNKNADALIASYARHVARRPHPEHPEWKIKNVKVYKVRHSIIPEEAILARVDPQDPYFYQPFFMGEFLPDGQIKDRLDPLLYWMMPIWRRDYAHKGPLTLDFARRHAGDENWASVVDDQGQRRWFKPTRAMLEP